MEQRRAEFKNAKMLSVRDLLCSLLINTSVTFVTSSPLPLSMIYATGLAAGKREDESGAGYRVARCAQHLLATALLALNVVTPKPFMSALCAGDLTLEEERFLKSQIDDKQEKTRNLQRASEEGTVQYNIA